MSPNQELEWKISDIDERLKKLENNNRQAEVLDILNKIKERLIGQGLEGDSPGLILDVKTLKENEKSIELRLVNIDNNVQEMRKNLNSRINLEDEIKDLKKQLDSLTKYRYLLVGGIVVVTWIVAHVGDIWGLLTAVKKP